MIKSIMVSTSKKYFEFGIENQTNEIVYSKYVGLIDMVQLEKIVDELLK